MGEDESVVLCACEIEVDAWKGVRVSLEEGIFEGEAEVVGGGNNYVPTLFVWVKNINYIN